MSAPVDHPPPWRWEEIGGVFSLRDARGVRILLGDERRGVHPDEPVAESLIAAAPEMAALLREWRQPCIERERWKRDQDDMGDRRDWEGLETSDPLPPVCGKCWSCRKSGLIARLDAARKADA